MRAKEKAHTNEIQVFELILCVEYTFTCLRLPDYVSDLLATYLALQKLSLAHKSSTPITIAFDAKFALFEPVCFLFLPNLFDSI